MPQEAANVAVLGSTGSIGTQHAGGDRAPAVSFAARRFRPIRGSICCWTRPGVSRPAGSWPPMPLAAAQQDWSALPDGSNLLIGPDGLETIASRAGSRHRRGRHRRQRRAAGHLGRRRGRQDRGPGQQREPGRGRPAGHRPGRAQRAPTSCPSTASTAPSSGHAGRAARGSASAIVLTASGGPFRNHTAEQLAASHGRRGPGPSHLGDGPEDHGRFGHDDEQGPGDHRGPLAVRLAARADRRGDPSAVDRPFAGRIRRRLGDRAAEPARHEAADPIRA